MEAETILEMEELPEADKPVEIKDHSIELKDVVFSYDPQGKKVLEKLNLMIPEKNFTCLGGPLWWREIYDCPTDSTIPGM